MNPSTWLRAHDPDLAALRRAGRTAIVMPGLFALGVMVLHDAQLATFAAFGAFAMLLLVEFPGPARQRVQAQVALGLAGAVLVCLGTLASTHAVAAAACAAVVGAAILFAGVVSSVLAGATTALLIALVLPVTAPAPVGTVPDRLAGWGLATAAALVAVTVLWPTPGRTPLRDAAARACRLLAERLCAEAGEGDTPPTDRARDAVERLRSGFFAAPYRPTGLSISARALVRLVDGLGWLADLTGDASPALEPGTDEVRTVQLRVAELLRAGADLLDDPSGPGDLQAGRAALDAALAELEFRATGSLPVATRRAAQPEQAVVTSLEPAFRAQELSFAVTAVAADIDRFAAAERRSWRERLLGRGTEGLRGPLTSARERAGAHLEPHSVWLRSSLRGAVALGTAVLVADVTGVQHSFWVVLGTLSVLRSNALNTGANALRAVAGTATGFVVGGAVVAVVGTNTTLLWFLLPVAVLVAGVAPTAVSFAAGQAAFTVTLVILYNIIAPVGWHVGLTRVEDIAIGCGVSVAVGAVFWPRGAASVLGRALGEAYTDSVGYLRAAVAVAAHHCTGGAVRAAPREAVVAAASARRLDDAFRTYLAERGGKAVPLAEVTTLLTGVAGLRLAADAVVGLWGSGGTLEGDRTAAARELTALAATVAGWYDELAAALAGEGAAPAPQPLDPAARLRLVDAVRADLLGPDGRGTAAAVRVVWTGDHLDAARRLEALLVDPARAVVAAWAGRRRWPSLPGARRVRGQRGGGIQASTPATSAAA